MSDITVTVKDVKTIKTEDLPLRVAAKIFEMLNKGVLMWEHYDGTYSIEMDGDPSEYIYPDGWYCENGQFTNGKGKAACMWHPDFYF